VASRLSQQMVWIKHRALLGERQDMEVIAEAIRKIHTCAGQLG